MDGGVVAGLALFSASLAIRPAYSVINLPLAISAAVIAGVGIIVGFPLAFLDDGRSIWLN